MYLCKRNASYMRMLTLPVRCVVRARVCVCFFHPTPSSSLPESARRLVGRGGARSSISLEIGNGRGGQFVEETPENRAVFDVVRDLRKVIEKQHLRQVSAWIRTLRNVAFPQRRPVPPLRSGVHIYGETAEKRRQELLSKAENIAQKLSVAQRQCRSLLGASSSPRTR
mmetsp:Transcript_3744/g.5930  ORF Transcript_3744/g.5930 Transcript_3744/m.5930 type:complete len:168 (+) Transcript_3744:259-762(+)